MLCTHAMCYINKTFTACKYIGVVEYESMLTTGMQYI
jgi:hypothetical protein